GRPVRAWRGSIAIGRSDKSMMPHHLPPAGSGPSHPGSSGTPTRDASHPAPGAGARRPALIVAGLAVLLLVAHPASALFSPLGRLTTASALISSLVSEATTLLLIALTAAGIQLVRRSRTDGDRLAL